TWRPSVALAYTSDRQKAFTDSLGTEIPEQLVALGELAFGIAFDRPMSAKDTLTGGVSGIWRHASTDSPLAALDASDTSGHVRIDFGWRHTAENGVNWEFGGYADGLGRTDYQSHGLTMQLGYTF
ncbi:MAG: hypothetical protein RLN70_07545, partial [Rhodospirillaceae bacterium]